MKRLLTVAAVAAVAAAIAPAPAAHAGHVCVSHHGRQLACTPDPSVITIDPICVTVGGTPYVCVP